MIEMKSPRGRLTLVVAVVILAAACTFIWARSSTGLPLAPAATLRFDTNLPGNEFMPGGVGLSTETRALSSGRLSATHSRLVRLMRLLGPSVLRVGGDSVDTSWWTSSDEPAPSWATSTVTPADLVSLRRLLMATGWRVLLGVDLGHFEPVRVAEEAHYAHEILGADLLGIEIGNEPNGFGGKATDLRLSTYSVSEYLTEADAYDKALQTAAPGVAIYGPALAGGGPAMVGIRWLTQMGLAAHMFANITQHYYPTGTCPESLLSGPPPTAAGLLSVKVRRDEDEFLEFLAHVRTVDGRPTRIDETNGVSCKTGPTTNQSLANALWALDWILRAASGGVNGLNFHGTLSSCRSDNQAPICGSSNEAAGLGYVTAQPVYYGLLAASQLESGRFVPTRLIAPGALPNLTTWATLAPNGTVRIAIDYLATTGLTQPVFIAVPGYTATEEPLLASSATATNDITFGGASVTSGGQWRPKPVTLAPQDGSVRVLVRPGSAIVVTLRRR